MDGQRNTFSAEGCLCVYQGQCDSQGGAVFETQKTWGAHDRGQRTPTGRVHLRVTVWVGKWAGVLQEWALYVSRSHLTVSSWALGSRERCVSAARVRGTV